MCTYMCVYIYMLPLFPETHILYDFTTKNTVSCCFVVDAKHPPIGPDLHDSTSRQSTRSGAVSLATITICINISIYHSHYYSIIIMFYHKHDYYHCRCPCHDQYRHHHTYCKMKNVTKTMILVLLLACCYYDQV